MTLVWKKEKLAPSDTKLNLRFTRGEKINNEFIDPKTYFKDKVFHKLKWTEKSDTKEKEEEAYADFKIEIEGKAKGVFPLKINHRPDNEQKNTRIYWEEAMSVITEQDNSGKTLSLFRIGNEPNLFLIKIEKQVI